MFLYICRQASRHICTLCWFPPAPPFLASLPIFPSASVSFRLLLLPFPSYLSFLAFASGCSCSPSPTSTSHAFASGCLLPFPFRPSSSRSGLLLTPGEASTSSKVRPECIHRNMFDKDCPYVHLLMFFAFPHRKRKKETDPNIRAHLLI